MIVRGEGIFIEFREDKLEAWLAEQQKINDRVTRLSEQYNDARLQRGLAHFEMTPKLILLHTFAHLLVRQLSFDCGYGSAALRERIYCNLEPGGASMQGVLIYTAAGDSEGTWVVWFARENQEILSRVCWMPFVRRIGVHPILYVWKVSRREPIVLIWPPVMHARYCPKRPASTAIAYWIAR